VIERYGADAMRLYEMFMGPLERMKPWQTAGIEGLWRFLNKVWRVTVGDDRIEIKITNENPSPLLLKRGHQTIQKVSEDIENLRFNTAISHLMIFSNEIAEEVDKTGVIARETAETLIKLLQPFAPHLAEEIWEIIGNKSVLSYDAWPVFNPELAVENSVTVVFQTNGKVRVEHAVAKGTAKGALQAMAESHEKFKPYLENMTIVKVIVVADKLVNFVVKPN